MVYGRVLFGSSVAVLITVVVPFGKLEPLAGTLVTLTPGQLSLAVTTSVTLLAQCPGAVATLRFAGQLITGFSVSFTVTVKLHVLELPETSVAVLITVVVPYGNLDLLAGTLVTLTPGQLSLAVTTKVTLLAQLPGAVVTLRFAGQLITGFSVSFTVTVKLHVLELPETSVAVLITVVVPFGKLEPLAGTLVTLTPGQLSRSEERRVGKEGRSRGSPDQ